MADVTSMGAAFPASCSVTSMDVDYVFPEARNRCLWNADPD